MNQNRFSMARACTLIQRNIIENKRYLAMIFGVIFGLTLCISILITKAFHGDGRYYSDVAARIVAIATAFAWIAIITVQVLGSIAFNNLNSKSRRISALMLPAARSEKFFANIAIYLAGGNICLILFLFASDSLSAAIFGMSPAWTKIPLAEMFQSLQAAEISIAAILGLLWFGLFAQSIYLIGSVLWPRLSFLKTFVALLALQIVLPIILPLDMIGAALTNIFNVFDNWNAPEIVAHIMGWATMLMLYVLLAAMYLIAWHIYKRTEVIQRFKTR